jgi:hypothetical protein
VDVGNCIELAVRRWAAWPPDAAAGSRRDRLSPSTAPARPDVSFVAPLQRRRLSEVTQMAFAAAAECLREDEPVPGFVYCSRYGEYAESFESLQQIVRQEPISPTAFSMSVHNTAASQLAMHRKDRAPCSALAAGATTLEAGFVEAFAQIAESGASVIVVYHDQPLPALYREQPTTVKSGLALALLLDRPAAGGDEQSLRLAWRPSAAGPATACEERDPVCAVIRLLRRGGAPVTQDTGRLVWTWSRPSARL